MLALVLLSVSSFTTCRKAFDASASYSYWLNCTRPTHNFEHPALPNAKRAQASIIASMVCAAILPPFFAQMPVWS